MSHTFCARGSSSCASSTTSSRFTPGDNYLAGSATGACTDVDPSLTAVHNSTAHDTKQQLDLA
ncbi:hypothetical protein Pcac1_g27821 [Phytophthora cactorum]|nr:hypothetical protein Pcac1_g28808 [Phytophthora cactorum]KAG2760246.1 hypothetical protein Pcac1_g27821 [Phytophthora cactorum]